MTNFATKPTTTRVYIENHKSKSPPQVTRISRRLTDQVHKNPKSIKIPSPAPLPVNLPSPHHIMPSPSTYPPPRQVTRIYSPSTYPSSPSGYPPHTLSHSKHLSKASVSNPLEPSSKIPPNLPKRNQKITKILIQTPTFPDHLPSWADWSPPRSFFLVGFHFIAYYLFLSNGLWYTWTSKRYWTTTTLGSHKAWPNGS